LVVGVIEEKWMMTEVFVKMFALSNPWGRSDRRPRPSCP
jgi:hypothetical protein